MTNEIAQAARWYGQQTYGPLMWRRLAMALVAVPRALRTVVSARVARGLLALPVAAAATGLIAVLTDLIVINVVAYPWRPYLGLHGNDGGGIWASTYDGSWGGPSLAGAWAVHALGVMLLVFPALAWAVRGLLRAQARLSGTGIAAPRPQARKPARVPAPTAPRTPAHRARPWWYRLGVIVAALVLFFVLARLAHAAGIGDNVLWLPRDLSSGLALAVVLAPLAVAGLTARTWWHLRAARR